MRTIEDCLQRHAVERPDQMAVVSGHEAITYAQLCQRVCSRAETFRAYRGKPVVFRNSQDAEFVITYLAIHQAGAIAVPMAKEASDEQIRQTESELKGSEIAEDTADILYTTGTTGKAKGIMISHKAIMADGENLISAHGYDDRLTFIICGPLNHIGSLSKIYPVLICGATLYLLEGMKDLNAFFTALDYPCTKMGTFLVPASIRILITFCGDRLQKYADKIDFIETGAAPITRQDMKELCRLLPHSRLYNTYASTETGVISTYNFNDGKCVEGCLGRPMKHSHFLITTGGTIACQGPTLMSGYVNDRALTCRTLRDHTLYTSDIGEVDAEGRLHISGREDDIINTGGLKVAPLEVERVALAMPGIAECACISAPHPILGCAPKLLVVMKDGQMLDKKALARYIHSQLESYKVPAYYEQVSSIKRTFNGKIDRKHYRS